MWHTYCLYGLNQPLSRLAVKTTEHGLEHHEQRIFIQFISELQQFIGELIQEGHESSPFASYLRGNLPISWHETDIHFTEIRNQLAIVDILPLIQQGLTGKQLEFKFDLIKRFTQRFNECRRDKDMEKQTRRVLSQLLELHTELVRNLQDALGVGGAVSSYLLFLTKGLLDDASDIPAD